MKISQCTSCGAEIVWCYNSRTGRMAAIGYSPDPAGALVICTGAYSPLFVRLTRQAAAAVHPTIRRSEHRCPKQHRWTKKGGRAA